MKMPICNTFPKAYRVCGFHATKALITAPVIFKQYPFLVKMQERGVSATNEEILPSNLPQDAAFAQWLFVIPKKRFRRATVRNALRRQLREGVRKHQHALLQQLAASAKYRQFALYYIGSAEVEAAWLQGKIIQLLARLAILP